MSGFEANYDGLIGPTHNYGGLSAGNLASASNAGLIARPKAAALQGLAKMKLMHDSGLVQGILPPQARPDLAYLKSVGFVGTPEAMIKAAWDSDKRILRNVYSASSMWAANAATISPSADTQGRAMQISPANLSTMLHRSLEHAQTQRALGCAFPFAIVHEALPMHSDYSDEGAANHVRLCAEHGQSGVELFVYGRDAVDKEPAADFPARQTLQAARAIARRHSLEPSRTVYARQSVTAINAGAFHNDVVCVGALDSLFYHEHAFADTAAMQSDIRAAAKGLFEPQFIEVTEAQVPLADAIKAYLFNSMLVAMPGQSRLTLVAPLETQDNDATRRYCEQLISGNGPIGAVLYVDVRQSMRNGGGPACLRLRVAMTDSELKRAHKPLLMSDERFESLSDWVSRHYRDELAPDDLADPALMKESFTALDELTQLLSLGSSFYPFQRA